MSLVSALQIYISIEHGLHLHVGAQRTFLKSLCDRESIVHLMSPCFLLLPPPTYLPFPSSCSPAHFLLSVCSFLHKITHPCRSFALVLQILAFHADAFRHGDSPSSAGPSDSTPLSPCRICCSYYLPCWWKWAVVTLLERMGRLAMSRRV